MEHDLQKRQPQLKAQLPKNDFQGINSLIYIRFQ